MTRLIGLLLIGGTLVLAGCNTMAGAGQDISKGGTPLQIRLKNTSNTRRLLIALM